MKYVDITIPEPGIMLLTVNRMVPTKDQLKEFQEELKTLLETNSGCIQVYDGRNAKLLPADLRIESGKWSKRNEDFLKQHIVSSVYVLPNMIGKMILRGIFLVQKSVIPHKVVDSMEKGMEYARQQLSSNVL
ncbi:MAG TPA: hypothetical protein DCE41_32185 [Cytophagales bacterium]|nr:hypothetical protein [Cytophagales bacterium]HAA19012.1 hypothetical protein [Cytophagales bacterium]HAP61812.1 hypothetical protein [Cytophagales bacterium]